MVDALGHGTPAAADQAHDMVGRGAVQSGGDAQPGRLHHTGNAEQHLCRDSMLS